MTRFAIGLIIAALCVIVFHFNVCFVPVVFIAFACEIFNVGKTVKEWNWWDFAAMTIGGLLIQLFVILG